MATTSSWQRGPCATVRAAVPGHVPSPCPGRARGPVPSAGPVPGRVPGAHLPVTVPEPPCPPSPEAAQPLVRECRFPPLDTN